MKKAAIVTIGDEILIGQIIDTNKAYLSDLLTNQGWLITEQRTVSDQNTAIKEALNELSDKNDLLVFSGGLGPTKDDVTKKTVADYYDSPLVEYPDVLRKLTDYVHSRGREMTIQIADQAYYPREARIFLNSAGTAQGFMMSPEQGANALFLPGVPKEIQAIMTESVMPYLIEELSGAKGIYKKTLLTAMISETDIEKIVTSLQPDEVIKIAYLPHLGGVRVRATIIDSGELARKKVDDFILALSKELGHHALSTTHQDIVSLLHDILIQRKLTLSTAESCTGGFVGHRLTSLSGSSAYYMGGVISYSNEIKTKVLGVPAELISTHGAVSEPVARSMKEGVLDRFGTDLSISTTGIAGPTGGTPEKPVGTIWIGIGDKKHTVTKKLFYNRNRLMNIEYTSTAVFYEMIRFIKKYDLHG